MMQTTYVTPVVILLAAVSLTSGSSSVQAAEDECISKPGATAPQGSHWYYRVNRADGRHCWYLGPEGGHVHSAMSSDRATRMPRRTARRPVEATGEQSSSADSTPTRVAPTDMRAAPADTRAAPADTRAAPAGTRAAPADTTVGASDAAPEFAARWIDLPSALDAVARRQAAKISNSYSEERAATDAQDDMPLIWPILTPAELAAAAEPPHGFMVKWEYILGFLALVLALAAKVIGTLSGADAARPKTPSVFSRLTRFLRRAGIPPRSEVAFAGQGHERAAARRPARLDC
jgi:hypothetical protein